jgi:hypothetical protein
MTLQIKVLVWDRHTILWYCPFNVTIHFCDSMWSFWVEANICSFFYRLFYCLWITPSYQEWRIEIPFTVLAPPNCVPVPNQDLDLQRHMSLSFCVQWVRLSNIKGNISRLLRKKYWKCKVYFWQFLLYTAFFLHRLFEVKKKYNVLMSLLRM